MKWNNANDNNKTSSQPLLFVEKEAKGPIFWEAKNISKGAERPGGAERAEEETSSDSSCSPLSD